MPGPRPGMTAKKSTQQAVPMRPRNFLGMNEKTRFMLAVIAPAVLALVLFQVVPILSGANTSFRDWSLHDPKRTGVGLANYAHVSAIPTSCAWCFPIRLDSWRRASPARWFSACCSR